MCEKHVFLEFIEKIRYEFLPSLYYCSCTNPVVQFLRYGPKCSQRIILKEFFINHVSGTNL